MREHNIETLERFRNHWNSYQQLQWMPYLSEQDKSDVLQVIREDIDAGYMANLWCGNCVVEMFALAFRHLDNYLASKKATEAYKELKTKEIKETARRARK